MANYTGYLQDKSGNRLFIGNNYSEEEQIIGQWFGKPLYQSVKYVAELTTAPVIENASVFRYNSQWKIIDIEWYGKWSGQIWHNSLYIDEGTKWMQLRYWDRGNGDACQYMIQSNTTFQTTDNYFIFRYTKI